MSWGNLRSRPDLGPLFGAMTFDENSRLVDRLLALDDRLSRLASEATAHVGVEYQAVSLGLFVRSADAEIAGGPSGAAGDLWFEVGFTWDNLSQRYIAPPWTVESRLVVLCCDAPEPRGDSNTHDLVRLVETADTPTRTIDVLESHISSISEEVLGRRPASLTDACHAELP
jgi:hypothetical protein